MVHFMYEGGIMMQANILLVEDDPEIARVIRDTLLRKKHTVTWATTGLEGWEDFQQGDYDLVLIDLMLPEMDGFTLCKNIRLKSDLPMIIISARTEEKDKISGLDLGADDYVEKPFSVMELKARVDAQLRRWQRYKGIEENAPITTYENGLKIHWEYEQVFLFEEEISLTNKEFAVLKLLVEHPRRTFSKEELYEHVWSQLEAEGLHTVTVHIKSLREKLAESSKNPSFIETVWGKGYRFIGELL